MTKIERLSELEVFVHAVRLNGISAAARALGLTPAAASRKLGQLEGRLGVRLLHRTTRTLRMSDEGARYFPRAAAAIDELRAAEDELYEARAQLTGTLRVCLPSVMSGEDELLFGFMERHPELRVRLRTSDHGVSLLVRDVDVAITGVELRDSSFVARKLFSLSALMAASRSYVEARGLPRTPADLAEHDCLVFVAEEPERHWVLVDARGHEVVARVGGTLESDSSVLLRRALLRGHGVGLATEEMLLDEDIVQVLPGYRFQTFSLYAVYPSPRHLDPKVRAFVDYLVETYRI